MTPSSATLDTLTVRSTWPGWPKTPKPKSTSSLRWDFYYNGFNFFFAVPWFSLGRRLCHTSLKSPTVSSAAGRPLPVEKRQPHHRPGWRQAGQPGLRHGTSVLRHEQLLHQPGTVRSAYDTTKQENMCQFENKRIHWSNVFVLCRFWLRSSCGQTRPNTHWESTSCQRRWEATFWITFMCTI